MNRFKHKGLKQLLMKSFIFLVLIAILDFSIGSILRYYYFKQSSGFLYRTTYAMDSTKAQILIFGSSTANHHYYPEAFESRFNLPVYNTGRDGNTVFYNYAVLETVLKRFSPKIAILDFNIGEFQKGQDSYDRMSSLLPYYKNHPNIRPIIALRGPYEKYKLLSQIYPYNSLIFSIAIGNTQINRNREHVDDDKGYVALTNIWRKKLYIDTFVEKPNLDTNKIGTMRLFIQECAKANVQLYIFISPRFIKYQTKDPSIEITKSIAKEFGVPFKDFSKDSFFWSHPELFADATHLNNNGAKVYSNKVIDWMISVTPSLSKKINYEKDSTIIN